MGWVWVMGMGTGWVFGSFESPPPLLFAEVGRIVWMTAVEGTGLG
jgi:hypothetical protein